MTQNGINAAIANGPSLDLPNMHRGFGETSFDDGERIGVVFNYLPNGERVYGKAYDLNNPAQANDYNLFKSSLMNQEARSEQSYTPQYPRR